MPLPRVKRGRKVLALLVVLLLLGITLMNLKLSWSIEPEAPPEAPVRRQQVDSAPSGNNGETPFTFNKVFDQAKHLGPEELLDRVVFDSQGKKLPIFALDLRGFGVADSKRTIARVQPPPRVCGSPAVDGYAHVNLTCLRTSPTMQQWLELGGSNEGFVVWREDQASYDGIGVKWGPHNKKDSAEACALDCLNWAPKGDEFPCNVWVFCPDDVCFEPDAHKHTKGDCWLKFTELPSEPEVNQRGTMDAAYATRHQGFQGHTQWISGAVLPPTTPLGPGTMGPRAKWRRRRLA